jgi:hypothetical protein
MLKPKESAFTFYWVTLTIMVGLFADYSRSRLTLAQITSLKAKESGFKLNRSCTSSASMSSALRSAQVSKET